MTSLFTELDLRERRLDHPDALALIAEVQSYYVTLYGDWNLNGGVTNREGFALIRGFLPYDTYVKAGRLFPTFGLRVQDDMAFVRGHSGYTFTNPDEGGEIGFAPGPFFIARSTSSTLASPVATASTASRQIAACNRLTKWPGTSLLSWIGLLPTER